MRSAASEHIKTKLYTNLLTIRKYKWKLFVNENIIDFVREF